MKYLILVLLSILHLTVQRDQKAVKDYKTLTVSTAAGMAEIKDANGIITVSSTFTVKETITRLDSIVRSKGLTIFARIDHSANAQQQGLQLRPTELLIFGNPKSGTPLMQNKQTSGIDLPLKALAWQDESGKVWLSYNEASWIRDRHTLGEGSNATISAIENSMATFCYAATKIP